MGNKIVALVLVGGRGTRLMGITKTTVKPAVSFFGKYRIIDFTLSNLQYSSIDTIGLITQYEPYELMSYIGSGASWDLNMVDGGIKFLTPYESSNKIIMQNGTAHAVKQQLSFLKSYNADYVLILSGDHIYKMDYSLMISEHIKNKADLTIGTTKLYNEDLSRYGIVEADDSSRIIEFTEKPKEPKTNEISMGIYVFSYKALENVLNEYSFDDSIDFGKDIVPKMVKRGNTFRYLFNGYFKDVGTVESLYNANMELLDSLDILVSNAATNIQIYSKSFNLPPHITKENSEISESIISDGSVIDGKVIHSLVGYNCKIDTESIVENCVVMDNVVISTGAIIKNAIINKDIYIPPYFKKENEELELIDELYLEKRGDLNE